MCDIAHAHIYIFSFETETDLAKYAAIPNVGTLLHYLPVYTDNPVKPVNKITYRDVEKRQM